MTKVETLPKPFPFQIVKLTLCLFIMVLSSGCTADEEPPVNPNPTGPTGPSDQVINVSLFSTNIGEEYPTRIFIPKEYVDTKDLPIVYATDGLFEINGIINYDDVLNAVRASGVIAIIVAVGDKTGVERSKDFLAEGCLSGDGNSFNNYYKFISQEVVSYIDE